MVCCVVRYPGRIVGRQQSGPRCKAKRRGWKIGQWFWCHLVVFAARAPHIQCGIALGGGCQSCFLSAVPLYCGQNVTFQSTKNETENRSKKAVPSNFVINFLLLCHGMRVFKVTFFKCVKDTHVRDENRAAQLHIMKKLRTNNLDQEIA